MPPPGWLLGLSGLVLKGGGAGPGPSANKLEEGFQNHIYQYHTPLPQEPSSFPERKPCWPSKPEVLGPRFPDVGPLGWEA